MKTLNQAILEAQEQGYIDDENLPDCFGKEDPRTNTKYCCEECPLEPHCCEAFDEATSGVLIPD